MLHVCNPRVKSIGAEGYNLHGAKELQLPDDPVSALECASPSTALSEPEPSQHDWVPPFKNLRVCDAGVCHVSVDATAAVPCWPGSGPASYCFIVPKPRIPECQVVHATLQTTVHGFEIGAHCHG